ncbi:hypothetical protein C1646_760455 [Rhizophagus diaphanus]|nr:hypothetical protein C1646_760455 [Rhizophagus diaphanus] [Rhizophagus sp. MUCL 43196]
MSSLKCPYCPRTFTNKYKYTQHVSNCVPPPEIDNDSEESKLVANINDMSLDSEELTHNIEKMDHEDFSGSEINDQSMSISEDNKSIEINQNEDIEDTFEDILEDSNPNEKTFEDILEDSNPNEKTFEDILNILEDSDPNEKTFKDILEEFKSKVNASYPNEAYANLMTLVTKHKLSNTTGNAIIKFFNKYANLSTSPLPTSIKKGCKYMDDMDLPNLTYVKTCIMNYNNNEYYLHHRSLINCVKNILSIPDMSKNFVQKFENLKIDEKRAYSEQNTGTWCENAEKSIPNSSKLLSICANFWN